MIGYNLIGQKFGRLTVVSLAKKHDNSVKRYWVCQCDCGNIIEVQTSSLISGHTKSCGCYRIYKKKYEYDYENNIPRNDRIKSVWDGIKLRCSNPNCTGYKNYGGRDIKLCKEWENYYNFQKWSLENGYREDLTIDRINNDKGYSPDNCRWVTMKVQQNNKRNTAYYTYNGETKPFMEWCDLYHLTRDQIAYRIKNGWTPEEVLGIKKREKTRLRKKKKKIPKNCKTGVPGVRWHEETNKWMSYIRYKNKTYYLGFFSDFQEAKKKREEAELSFYGFYLYKQTQNNNVLDNNNETVDNNNEKLNDI